MRRHVIFAILLLAVAIASTTYKHARGQAASFSTLERGRYLTVAGDCQACHTTENGKPFAGGRAIPTPFGTIYSANITPDRATGIGARSDDQFYRALHAGIAANGEHLYPAFPYPWFTKVTREDADAIHAYLNTFDPINNTPPENKLDWPLNNRVVMEGWNDLFFTEGTFAPNANKSPEWNRGAYLVEGLGHCGACHTPTGIFGAPYSNKRLQGGTIQDWYAPNLAGDLKSGLGSWSNDDIVQFLKTGRNTRTAAYGPMAEVITRSTSKLNDSDLMAIATYLKDVPAATSKTQPAKPGPQLVQAGEAIYIDNCSACHRSNGQGTPGTFPALKGDTIVQSRDPTTVIRVILDGTRAVPTDNRPTPLAMPSFKWKLTDDEVAAVASYVRSAWGNSAAAVSKSEAQTMRQKLSENANQ